MESRDMRRDGKRVNFYVNGRFLSKTMTGVERYAGELVSALDAVLAEEGAGGDRWTVLAPPGTERAGPWRHIALRTGGRGTGHFWEQLSLPGMAADGVLLNLANSGPVRHPRSFTVIHDAIVYRMPRLFSFRYRTLHQGLGLALSRRSRLGTVSAFSRDELSGVLGLDPERIRVVPNGADHLGRTPPDREILDRLGLRHDGFLLFVGSHAPHKNLQRALEAFAAIEAHDRRFVIVGSSNAGVFGKAAAVLPTGALAAGRLEDAEIAALYAHATALVFPSLYEGFGIPPLEAMSYGCPVLASDIPPIREVCADAARYFDPERTDDIARVLAHAVGAGREGLAQSEAAERRLKAFDWRASARILREEAHRTAQAGR
ncbi:glycosyltransferase family 1 protein [Aureimonas sp. SK2]|uniref:glycosyltransferase family 4 protein n=1 Tax=Aureimonas sp. SK2 TaxID=3015992 RepID=UPI0024450EE8|nr:glycosyltransferase family 1 protein [Aureimonas sp. SK2]